MTATIRILIVDDHTLVREGITALMETVPDIQVLGEARDGSEAVEKTMALSPDVVLLDLAMPHKDGLSALQEIKTHKPEVRVLIITSFTEGDKIYEALRFGASGYLLKDSSADELLQGIRSVFQGKNYLPPNVTHKLVGEINRSGEPGPEPALLTEREKTVLEMLTQGLSNKEIALKLTLSQRTVEAHVRNILKKLNLSSRAKVIRFITQEREHFGSA